MNPLIRKEIRLLLPFLGIALFLAVVPSFVLPMDSWGSGVYDLIFWAFGFGAVLLGLAPFGQEFSMGTFPSLLAQPFERRRIWNTKTVLTIVAGLLVLLAFVLVMHLRLDASLQGDLERIEKGLAQNGKGIQLFERETRNLYHSEFWYSCVGGGALTMLVAVIGGFWTALLFRQIGAALWFSILIPGIILVASEIVGRLFPVNANDFLVPALLVYAVAGFIWARRLFLKAQDAQWLGGTISMLSLSPAKAQVESDTARGHKPIAALLRKEFQSHQVSLLIAFGLLVLHMATMMIRRFISLPPNSEMRFALEEVPMLWLLIPWVIGCVAVAEERKLGTLEGQLCLPVTRRAQFFTKFSVVLLLGIVLGGLMPCLIEALGTRVGIPSDILQLHNSTDFGLLVDTLKETTILACVIAFVSFFASTLTRNTLHALGVAIPMAVVFFVLFAWLESGGYHNADFLWRGPLILYISITVWVVTVVCLGFWNYKRVHAGRKVWLRNVLVLAVALFCAGLSAAVIYQRPWELAMSLEPKQGPARLNGPVRPKICLVANRVFALLPDGRLWAATDFHWQVVAHYMSEENTARGQRLKPETASLPVPRSGMFVGGSNWTALVADDRAAEVVALQSDGSLWSIISARGGGNFWRRWLPIKPEPRRIGSDSDWKSVASGNGYFAAVKEDGTLWAWGYDDFNRFGFESTNYIAEPVRLGTNSDWERVFSGYDYALLMKQNGDIWEWAEAASGSDLRFIPMKWNGADWIEARSGFQHLLAIREDGSLWAAGEGRFFGMRINSMRPALNTTHFIPNELIRIGHDTDWVQVSADGSVPVGVKSNGRLVETGRELFGATLGRPSAHRGWMAVDSHWESFVALNADGTISLWCDTRAWNPNKLLASSRRPLWSLNIFSDSKN
ncbi:MAG TPA: ABC transporter permease subunit [Candidatus Angelobacter sp.]|nr:ABC transporter permease subunit [Candidatus Angelobacter sp.]